MIGLPNAGKSTFLSVTTRAKPKIADYPFTTLIPQLGVVRFNSEEFIIADIPGLIEGAHYGRGLGDRFLAHVERCSALIHLVDITQEDPLEAYKILRNELCSYSNEMGQKTEIVVLNKIDAIDGNEAQKIKKKFEKTINNQVSLISAATNSGISEVLQKILEIKKSREEESQSESEIESEI